MQIVDGLTYCHACGIVHRDVKLDNLLLDDQRNIRIVDFGVMRTHPLSKPPSRAHSHTHMRTRTRCKLTDTQHTYYLSLSLSQDFRYHIRRDKSFGKHAARHHTRLPKSLPDALMRRFARQKTHMHTHTHIHAHIHTHAHTRCCVHNACGVTFFVPVHTGAMAHT